MSATSSASGNTPPGPRNFGQLVAEHEDGRFHNAASDALHELLLRIRDAAGLRGGNAKGTLTIKLEIEQEDGNIEITAEITSKAPKLRRGRSIYWMTPEGHLTRGNPNQPELPLRDVSASAGATVARNLA